MLAWRRPLEEHAIVVIVLSEERAPAREVLSDLLAGKVVFVIAQMQDFQFTKCCRPLQHMQMVLPECLSQLVQLSLFHLHF